MDDLFGRGGKEMEQRVLTRLGNDFQVGSEDLNNVTFARQRMRWTQDTQNGPYIEVSQNNAIGEMEEIPVERHTKEHFHCTPSMHRAQEPTGTDKLATEQDPVPMLIQIFQMCIDGSFSNIWRC